MKLQDFLSQDQILEDKAFLETYGKDWNPHYKPSPSKIIFVKTTEQVQKLVEYAQQHKVGLVPSGGRTGLSGGATATKKEMVVSFERMNQILDFNSRDQIVTCEAGVITEDLQNFAKEKGFFFPIDFASKGSSQLGGNVATNAGGVKVIRYGLTRQWITNLKVVTGRGDTLTLNHNLFKNATGYDLRHLFIGSEGTLGLITEVSCRLAKPPKNLQVIVLSISDLETLMKVFEKFYKSFELTAFEMFSHEALELNLKSSQKPNPLSHKAPFYALIEVEEDQKLLLEVFEQLTKEELVLGGEISQTHQQFQALWSLRENISEALQPFKPHKNDISVRISQIPEFLKEMNKVLKDNYPDFQVIWFGHIGDGNLHINILKPQSMTIEEFTQKCKQSDELLFSMLKKYHGSISAEHGVGLLKKPFLHFTRTPEEIAIMKGIKSIFDPHGILNPGKIF